VTRLLPTLRGRRLLLSRTLLIYIRIGVVALDDGTVYGENSSRAFGDYVDNISTQQAIDQGILSMLERRGLRATNRT